MIKYNRGNVVDFDKTVVALGTFDGLHSAHMKIINKAFDYAEKNNIKCGVMMFDSIPANVVNSFQTPQITNVDDRYELLPHIDFVYVEKFDKEFCSKSPEEFVIYLKQTLKAVAVSVGFNYRFGKNASGDVDVLKTICKKYGIEVFVTEKTVLDGKVVSSTEIRNLIKDGKVKEASNLLGRPFFITGMVNHGFGNGQKMGIPTANLVLKPAIVKPKEGVYAGFCVVDGVKIKSVINVGTNPTFAGKELTVECHLIDFEGDLYNKQISAHLCEFIREEIKFNSPDELVGQIKKDITFVQKL